MSPEVLKLLIGLGVCIVVAIIAIAMMASKKNGSSSSSSSASASSASSASSAQSSTSIPSYEDLPSPSEEGEAPADSTEAAPLRSMTEEVPTPSDSTISFKEPVAQTPVTSTPEIPAVPKTYFLRLQDAYGKAGDEEVEVWYYNPSTKKKTKLASLKMGKSISKKKTHDILLSKDSVPLITDVSFYLRSGSTDAYLPYIYLVEKEGSTDMAVSENFAPLVYNNDKKYVYDSKMKAAGLYWVKQTYYFKLK